MGSTAKCFGSGYSVPLTFVDNATTTTADLFDPVVNKGHKAALVGMKDLSVDRDAERQYVADGIASLTCTIGREATATAYSFEDRIFRIQLDFDRCESRDEVAIMGFDKLELPFEYAPCRGMDISQKDYDTALYRSIKARNAYGFTRQGQPGLFDFQWSRFMGGEHEAAERRYVYDLSCGGGKEMRQHISQMDRPYKCLIDIDNGDPAHWSATAMYEFYNSGIVWDEAYLHLTSKRLFVDMATEQRAAISMLPGLQAEIDSIKADITDRLAAKTSEDNAVSDILGAGN